MARVLGRAHAFGEKVNWEIGDHPEWKLIFKEGWERNLRLGGYYAGHSSLKAMKDALLEQHRRQQISSAPQSPSYGGDDEYAGREESSSWMAPSRVAQYAQDGASDKETMQHHKRRNKTLATSHGEADVPSKWSKLDGRHDKLHRARGENRNTSLVPWEPVSEFASDEKFCSPFGKWDRHVLALPAPHGVSRSREGNVSSGQDADHKARKFVDDKRSPGTVVDMYVLKCANRLVPITDLPVCIGGTGRGGTRDENVFLTGRFGGRTKSFPVDMWKMVLSRGSEPYLFLKTTGGFWLRLLKPQACYLKTISDCYILAHFLDYVKKTPSASVIAVEKYLAKACSMYGQGPFLEKLSKHLRLIGRFLEGDEDLNGASVLRAVFPSLFTKDSTELRADSSQRSRQVLRSVLGLNGHREKGNEPATANRRQDQMWGEALSAGDSSAEGYVPERIPVDYGTKTRKILGTHGFEPVPSEGKNLKRSRPSKLDQERHDTEKGKNDRKRSSWGVGSSRLQSEDSHRVSTGGVSRPKGERKSTHRSHTKTSKLDDPPVCVLCDDGGDLLICDGPCSRYFHAWPGTGVESFCQTLGLSRKETKAERWFCKNCEHKQHQCFICGELGSTDTALGRPQVYMCEVPSCKRFYHAHCVAELVDFPNWRIKANGIRSGTERLICPRHKCDTCRLTEMTPGILVQCRRCPKAWHRECFTNYGLSCELRTTTIWSHDQQEFVYCRQHKINPTLMTPDRDHVRFPEVVESTKMKKIRFKSTGLEGTIIERQFCETLPPSSLAAEIGLMNQ